MPLLRQSLYQQNINLYLAPTADGRDAWLGLMRTVALEGRCFVISSNMCVRSSSQKNQTEQIGSAASPAAAPHDRESPLSRVASPPQAHHGSTTRRRNSCFTEEGFEIALPRAAPTTSGSSSPSRARKERRRSIFDEDGNEIVLPCEGKEKIVPAAYIVVEEDEGVDVSVVDDAQKQKQQGTDAAAVTGKSMATVADNFLTRGGSSIVSPTGDVIAGPQWEDDHGIIYADVDFEDCIRGRLDLDAAGSYSRYGSRSFLFNHTRQSFDTPNYLIPTIELLLTTRLLPEMTRSNFRLRDSILTPCRTRSLRLYCLVMWKWIFDEGGI